MMQGVNQQQPPLGFVPHPSQLPHMQSHPVPPVAAGLPAQVLTTAQPPLEAHAAIQQVQYPAPPESAAAPARQGHDVSHTRDQPGSQARGEPRAEPKGDRPRAPGRGPASAGPGAPRQDAAAAAAAAGSGERERGGQGENAGPVSTLEFLVPSEAVGMIVGKKGAHIKRFKQECNVRVLIRKDEEGQETPTKAVLLEGSGPGLDKATLILCETLAQWAENTKQDQQRMSVDFWMKDLKAQPQKPVQPPAPAPAPRKPVAPQQQQQQPQVSGRVGKASHRDDASKPGVVIQYKLPSDAVRLLFGKQDKTINQLKRDTGCQITVGNDYPGEPSSKLLSVQGGEEQCVEARKRIIDFLARSKMEVATGLANTEDQMAVYRARMLWFEQRFEQLSITAVEPAQARQERNTGGSAADRAARQSAQAQSIAQTQSVAPGKVEIHITKAATAMIIGKKGTMHKSLQTRSGATILVEQEPLIDGRRRLTIEGSEQSINIARRLVEEILLQCDDSKYEETERKKQAEDEEKRRAEEAVRKQRKEEQAKRQAQVT